MTVSHRLRLAAALFLLAAPVARAQGTALVAPGDIAYVDLDRLLGLGLLDSAIVGQRPYSEREVARLLGIAHRRAGAVRDAAEQRLVDAALARLDHRFGDDGTARAPFALFDGGSVVGTSTDARRRPVLGGNGAQVATTIDPLADRRLGEPAVRGRTLALELAQRAEPTDWLAVRLRERVEGRDPLDSALSGSNAELLLGSVRARWRNVGITAGREQFAWAQRQGDGLILASDAPALDGVSLASDRPFMLPSFLRHLGPAAGTIVFADLGASEMRSHSKLLAYKLSVTPTSALELGATFENHFGGSGGRSSSAGSQLIDFLPFIDIFRRHNYYDTTRTLDVESDKVVGIDGRLTLRRLGGVVVAGEWLIDDFDASRLLAAFNNDASQSLAILIPRLGTPTLSLELSAKHMGIWTYTHATLTNGMTTRGRLLGDELGPDVKAFGATLRWQPAPATLFTLDGRSAVYSDVKYFGSDSSGTTKWSVLKVSSNPNELRERLLVSAVHHLDDHLALTARAGVERVRNARYFGDRTPYVVEMGARFLP